MAESTQSPAGRRFSYQAVPGASGAAGHDRSYLNDVIFGTGIADQTILDIGCYLGFFCLEALRRGAAGATGIEPDLECVRRANEIAAANGQAPEYIAGDFESWDWGGRRFDVVLCLNILHHMFDPVHALRRIMRLARSKVVLEFAAPRPRDLLRTRINPLALLAGSLPAILLGAPKRTEDVAAQSFLFTAKAMEVLFNKHTTAFEPVTITKSPFKGRLVLEARRRRIGHLVVVTGPTASGKSTLIKRIAGDPACCGRLGLEDGPWLLTDAHVKNLPRGRVDRAIMHYDLLRPYRRSIKAYDRDPATDLFGEAEALSVVTLMVAPDRLRDQLRTSELTGRRGQRRKRQADIHERYAERDFLRSWYEAWFALVARHAPRLRNNAIVVRRGAADDILPAQCWREVYEGLLGNT
ncbi:MAG: methyltransferase domain-containing protein [Alphaproteobacteria bacterium]|nr:methyltransferase domain-containing protein [Alphaproteobacteria bacterium]